MDDLDKRIIDLKKQGMSIRGIGRKLNVSHVAIMKRLKRIEADGNQSKNRSPSPNSNTGTPGGNLDNQAGNTTLTPEILPSQETLIPAIPDRPLPQNGKFLTFKETRSLKRSRNKTKKYNDKIPNFAYEMIMQGYSDYQVADMLDVHPQTFSGWKKEHKELGEACARAYEERTIRGLLPAMWDAAVGSHKPETRIVTGANDEIIQKEVRNRFIPPSYKHGELLLRLNVPEAREILSNQTQISLAVGLSMDVKFIG